MSVEMIVGLSLIAVALLLLIWVALFLSTESHGKLPRFMASAVLIAIMGGGIVSDALETTPDQNTSLAVVPSPTKNPNDLLPWRHVAQHVSGPQIYKARQELGEGGNTTILVEGRSGGCNAEHDIMEGTAKKIGFAEKHLFIIADVNKVDKLDEVLEESGATATPDCRVLLLRGDNYTEICNALDGEQCHAAVQWMIDLYKP